jgi:hypothetical protein
MDLDNEWKNWLIRSVRVHHLLNLQILVLLFYTNGQNIRLVPCGERTSSTP